MTTVMVMLTANARRSFFIGSLLPCGGLGKGANEL
jgi:hypothetical protein